MTPLSTIHLRHSQLMKKAASLCLRVANSIFSTPGMYESVSSSPCLISDNALIVTERPFCSNTQFGIQLSIIKISTYVERMRLQERERDQLQSALKTRIHQSSLTRLYYTCQRPGPIFPRGAQDHLSVNYTLEKDIPKRPVARTIGRINDLLFCHSCFSNGERTSYCEDKSASASHSDVSLAMRLVYAGRK